jgi:hypothetical protein
MGVNEMPASGHARRGTVLCGLYTDAICWPQDRWESRIEKPDIMSRFDELAKTEVTWRESEAQRERQPAKRTTSALVAAVQPIIRAVSLRGEIATAMICRSRAGVLTIL